MHHVTLSTGAHLLGPSVILLDNQSSVHIFRNRQLLTDLHDSSVFLHLGGIVDGHVLKTRSLGSFLDIATGNVWHSERTAANVLSLHLLVMDGLPIVYDNESDCFSVHTPSDGVMLFPWDDSVGHYMCDFALHTREHEKMSAIVAGTAFTTIADNVAKYPQRLIKAARRAWILQQRAGFPSTGKLSELISSSNLINESTSVQDIERAADVFGPSVPALKGKTQKKQPTTIPVERPRRVIRDVLTLHVDIIFMRGVPYLLSVTTPLGYLMIEALTPKATPVAIEDMASFAKSPKNIRTALLHMLNQYRARNYAVRTLLTDNESGVEKLNDELLEMGVITIPMGPGQHVALVEHKAKLVKQRRRCHIYHVPFAIPLIMEMYLVYHCVFTLNCMPTRTRGDSVAPAVDFLGRKLDSERDLRFVWGDLCQAHNTNNTITNGDAARTDTCVLLLSTGNLNGSVKMMNLSTWNIITRDQWTVIPYDQSTIMSITAKALKDDLSLSTKQRAAHGSKDAIFRRVHHIIDDDIGDEPPAVVLPTEDPAVLHDAIPDESISDDPDIEPITEHDEPDVAPIMEHDNSAEHIVPSPVFDLSSSDDSVHQRGVSDSPADLTSEIEPHETVSDTVIPEPVGVTESPIVDDPIPVPPAADPPRQSQRVRKPPQRFLSFAARASFHRRYRKASAYCAVKKDIIDHITPRKALRKFRGAAIKSIVKELSGILSKECFNGVDITTLNTKQKRKIIRSSMFLKEKYLADGSFEKLKSRLVAGGHMQDRSDMGDVSSPVVSTLCVYMIAALAAKERRKVVCVDIASAFLNSDMSGENVLMSLDPLLAKILCGIDPSYTEFLNPDGSIVVHLTKALYGCVRSSMLWFQTLSAFLVECGFTQNPYDQCVFNKTTDGAQCTVCFHVDDLMITCTDQLAIDALTNALKARFGSISTHYGDQHNYLGAIFDFSTVGKVNISMPHHTQQIIEDSGVTGMANTPAAPTLFDIDKGSPRLDDTDKKYFHSYVHRVMYLANRLNGECLVACAFLSSRVQSPTAEDMSKLQRLLQYLNANPALCLTLEIGAEPGVVQYTDASYGVHADGKSHTGSSLTLGKGAFHARSVKQKIVTKSSSEAEFVALSDEASRGLWCNYFLGAQGYNTPPLVQMQDNMSAIAIANKGRATAQRTRHINIRYFWITDYIDRGEMCLEHKPTHDMIADGLTKPLQGVDFIRMRNLLLNSFSIDTLDVDAISDASTA